MLVEGGHGGWLAGPWVRACVRACGVRPHHEGGRLGVVLRAEEEVTDRLHAHERLPRRRGRRAGKGRVSEALALRGVPARTK